MCWSGEASAVLATVGISATVYIAKKGDSKELWIPLGYFSLMEVLQAGIYVFIDDCGNPWNQALTHLGYMHIAFQPFFANMVAMYFVPEKVKRRIQRPVYIICGIAAVLILAKMIPATSLGMCHVGTEGYCGPIACSFSGLWHIAWQLPLNGLMSGPVPFLFGFESGLHGYAYVLAVFFMPVIYGSWRLVGFHFLIGPFISYLTTNNPNELIAVWCLYSIALCLAVIKSPVRRYLHVTSWLFYGLARARLRPAPLTTVAVNAGPDKTITEGDSAGLGGSVTHSRNTQPSSA